MIQDQETPVNIRRIREAIGSTQEGLARRLGVSLSTISRWEQGRNRPSHLALSSLEQLCTELGLQQHGMTCRKEGS